MDKNEWKTFLVSVTAFIGFFIAFMFAFEAGQRGTAFIIAAVFGGIAVHYGKKRKEREKNKK